MQVLFPRQAELVPPARKESKWPHIAVTHKGIWVILGLLPQGSTLDLSTLDSTMWSTQVFEYP